MCIETLVIACIVLLIGYIVVENVVPAPWKRVGYAVLIGMAVIWLFSSGHLQGLLHLRGC